MLNAKYTILTHFSQRYPKNLNQDQGARGNAAVPSISLQERAGDYKTFVCAHDLMKLKFDDLNAICQLRDDIEACFLDEDDYKCLLNMELFIYRGVSFSRANGCLCTLIIPGLLLDESRKHFQPDNRIFGCMCVFASLEIVV